jgi:hypothetical protein
LNRTGFTAIAWAALSLGLAGCAGDVTPREESAEYRSSRAYKGHANDLDMKRLVSAYPEIVGSRLDDCRSCHTGGEVVVGGEKRFRNTCDYCHLVPLPDESTTGVPESYEQTLNPFGLDYLRAGRNGAALERLERRDSDGDGFASGDEIRAFRYPGSADSNPGRPRTKIVTFTLEDLERMPRHTEFLLVNAHSRRFDAYATYTGVRVRDLLIQAGVDPEGISGITVMAVDGFMKDFDVEAVMGRYPAGLFYSGLDVAGLGSGCGFVDYPATLPRGLVDGGEIPGEQWLMLAYARDGNELTASHLEPVSGRSEGEGPLRLVVPQSRPGKPDRGSDYSLSGCGDGHDLDEGADHNAGSMVRGVVAIRINPMPGEFEEFDAFGGGWARLNAGELVLYGSGIE